MERLHRQRVRVSPLKRCRDQTDEHAFPGLFGRRLLDTLELAGGIGSWFRKSEIQADFELG